MLQSVEKILDIPFDLGEGKKQKLSVSGDARFVVHHNATRGTVKVYDLGERLLDVRRQQKAVFDYHDDDDDDDCAWKEIRISADAKHVLSVRCYNFPEENRSEFKFYQDRLSSTGKRCREEVGTVAWRSHCLPPPVDVCWSDDTRHFALAIDDETILVSEKKEEYGNRFGGVFAVRSVACAHVGKMASICIDDDGTVYFCGRPDGKNMRFAMQTNDVCETTHFTASTYSNRSSGTVRLSASNNAIVARGGDGEMREIRFGASNMVQITRPALRIFPGFDDVVRSDAKRYKRARAPELDFLHANVAVAFYDDRVILYRL